MKKQVFLWVTIMLLSATQSNAKELQALFYNASFFSQVEGPYVETYLKIFGPSATYVKTARGTYQASLKVTLLFKKSDQIVDFRKYNLLSAELEDTLKNQPNFIDQQRIPLPYGDYKIEISIADNNSKEVPIKKTCDLVMKYNSTEVKFSDFQFVESFQPTKKENILTKNGFDLVPYVGNFFPPSINLLTFYAELYNSDKRIGEHQNILLRYYLELAESQTLLTGFSKFQRQPSAGVNPLLANLDISKLPSGNYHMVIEARDSKNEVIAVNKIYFERDNPGVLFDLSDIKLVDVSATFAEKITSLDSLTFYVESLTPIATNSEGQFIKQVVKGQESAQMQKFLFNFWKGRNEKNPEAEFNSYKSQVFAIEERYKTKIKHGYQTDMGYVWLKYGTPNQVEDVKSEPNGYPYIIWHYFHIDNQSNVRFVFINTNLVGDEYALAYSDAKGDRYTNDWQTLIYSRPSSFGVGAGWGSRAKSEFEK